MNFLTSLLILSLVIFWQGLNAQEPDIIVAANNKRSYDTVLIYRKDTTLVKAYDIKIAIKNNADELISFWMMKCSWEDNFIINNDYFYFIRKWCDGNYPYVIHLKPDESKIFNSTIIKQNNTRYQRVKTTKFGLIYIDRAQCHDPLDFDNIVGDKSKHNKIIWSNSLYLNVNNQ